MERIHVLNGHMLECLEAFRTMIPIHIESVVSASSLVLDSIVKIHNEKLEILNTMNERQESPVFQTPPRDRAVQPSYPPRLARQVAVGGPLDESGLGWYSRQVRRQMGSAWYADELQRQTNRARFDRSNESSEIDSPADGGPLELQELQDSPTPSTNAEAEPTTSTMLRETAFYNEGFNYDEYYSRLMNGNWTVEDPPTDAQQEPGIDDGIEMSMANVTVRPRRVERCERTYRTLLSDIMDQSHNNSCNVCFETPTIRNACFTNCGHHFCKTCFHNWESATRREFGRVITCPVCRAERPSVTEFEFM